MENTSMTTATVFGMSCSADSLYSGCSIPIATKLMVFFYISR